MTALDSHVHRWEAATESGAPTLLLLHGTGGDESDLLPLARLIAPSAAVLGVRGNVMEQGMPRFFRRLREGVFDLEDLHRRTAELSAFLTAAAERYRFTPTNLYALGFSNGANIAASLLLSEPHVLAGGILIRAMIPFEPDHLPDLSGRAVLLSEGRQDPLVPPGHGERLAQLLSGAGAEVELAWQSGGHGLTQGDVTTARRWLGQRSHRPVDP